MSPRKYGKKDRLSLYVAVGFWFSVAVELCSDVGRGARRGAKYCDDYNFDGHDENDDYCKDDDCTDDYCNDYCNG